MLKSEMRFIAIEVEIVRAEVLDLSAVLRRNSPLKRIVTDMGWARASNWKNLYP